MAAIGETRRANEEMTPGQSLYLQAMSCLDNRTGKNPKISGALNCNQEEIRQAVQSLGLSDGKGPSSLFSLHFELSLGNRWPIKRKEAKLLLEAGLRSARNNVLVLTIGPDGGCQHEIVQKDLTIGFDGIAKKEGKTTAKRKKRTEEEEIGLFQTILSEIQVLATA
jgi:hypothetical protein